MEYVQINNAKKYKNSNSCTVLDYSLKNPNISAVIIKLNGRYPDNGVAVNTECEEVAYIIDGKGKLVVDKKVVNLKKDDVVLINPGEKFYWQGKLTMFMPCAPAWTPKQHKIMVSLDRQEATTKSRYSGILS